MSVAAISYKSLRHSADEAKDVAKKLDAYADSIYKHVYKKLNNYDGSRTENITSASSRANSKISRLRDDADKQRSYASDLDSLEETCKSVDKAVKSRVSSLTASFKDAYDISNNPVINGISYLCTSFGNSTSFGRWLNQKWDDGKAGMTYLKDTIKQWYGYEGGREAIKGLLVGAFELALGIVAVVGAVAALVAGAVGFALAGAIAGLIGGVIAIVNACMNLYSEGRAYAAAQHNDPATGKRLSELNTVQDHLRIETDSEFWHGVATGIDVVSIVCTVVSLVSSGADLIKNGYKWATGETDELAKIKWKDIWDDRGQVWSKIKTTFTDGYDELSRAVRMKDYGYFKTGFKNFTTDFLTNLKKSFTNIKGWDATASKVDIANVVKGNTKVLKNILTVGKELSMLGFGEANGWKLLDTIALSNIGTVGYATLVVPGGGGQAYFDWGSIKVSDILKPFNGGNSIKTSLEDFVDTFDRHISKDLLKKINSLSGIDISIPGCYAPVMY